MEAFKSKLRGLLISFAFLFLISLAHAQAVSYLESALQNICQDIQNLIPTASMLLVVLGSVLYGGAQLFGNAEIRAKGSVWATSCITGAIMGLIIATVAPDILSQLAGVDVTAYC
jgi:hypothetical protein